MSVNKEELLDLEPLDKILSSRNDIGSDNLIPILQEIQREYGYLPPEVLFELSRRTNIAASRIYGVATFYEQFYLEPHGRNTIRCCRGTACHVRGGQGVIRSVARTLGVEQGQTTEDMEFTFETVACLGACALSPVMVVNGAYYGKMTPQKTKVLLAHLKTAGREVDE